MRRSTYRSLHTSLLSVVACAAAALAADTRSASAGPFDEITPEVLDQASDAVNIAVNKHDFSYADLCENWDPDFKKKQAKAPLWAGAVKYGCKIRGYPAVLLFHQKREQDKPKNTKQNMIAEVTTIKSIAAHGLRIVPTDSAVLSVPYLDEKTFETNLDVKNKVYGYVQAFMVTDDFARFHTIEYLSERRNLDEDPPLTAVDVTAALAGGQPAQEQARLATFCRDLVAYKTLVEQGFMINDEQGGIHKPTGEIYFNDPVSTYTLTAPAHLALLPGSWTTTPSTASPIKMAKRLNQLIGMNNVYRAHCSRLFMY